MTGDEVLEDLVTEAREPGGNCSEGATKNWSQLRLGIEFPNHVIELVLGVIDVESHQTCGI